MKTLAQQALAAGSIHMSGTEGSILLVVLGVIIALALLGGWHLYAPHKP